MGEKSVWDNVKKFVGSIVMTGTIMGANGVSLANDINVNDNINNQVNNEQVYDYDFQERFRSGETGLSSIDSRAFFKSGDRAGTFIDGKKDFAEKKGWWNKELEDKCNKILGDRKKVADAMNKFEEKKFDELKVPKELLEKYSSMNLKKF